MYMYPESFIKELENTITISDLIGRKLPLKRRGRDFVACCPFHHEKTPSFSVSDLKGIYHCFGCGESGNIFTFIMKTEGFGFKEAVEYIANLYGISLPKLENKKEFKKEEIDEIELLYKINELSCRFFEENLFKFYGKDALAYATKRGLSRENIKKFRIGFAPDDYSMLMVFLKEQGFDEKIMEKSGVISKGDKGYYDKFRNRLMFPVFDKKGRVVAFQGRILGDGMPKYMNSPETKIFIKGNTLFNYYFARKSIYDNAFGVLVEGNMDAISLSVNGVENVVAPMGTGITENQIRELWSSTNDIFVCLDGDSAGQKASQRLAKLVLPIISTGKNIKFVFLPKNTDPDDFIRKYGRIEFDKLLKTSISLSDYLWDNELESLKIDSGSVIVPEKKAQLEKGIFKLLDLIKDLKLKSHFEQFYRNKIWKIDRISKKEKNEVKSNIKKVVSRVDLKTSEKAENRERKIVSLIVKYPNLVKNLFEKYAIDIFSINFFDEKASDVINIIEECFDLDDGVNNLHKVLVKNELSDYITYNDDICFNNSCVNSLTEEKSLEIVNILLLEKEVILLEFDLKEASKNGDIVKSKKLSEEILSLKSKISSLLAKSSFI